MHVHVYASNMCELRPPNLGTWKRGAIFLLSAFFLPAPGLAPPPFFTHKLNMEAITPNNAHVQCTHKHSQMTWSLDYSINQIRVLKSTRIFQNVLATKLLPCNCTFNYSYMLTSLIIITVHITTIHVHVHVVIHSTIGSAVLVGTLIH